MARACDEVDVLVVGGGPAGLSAAGTAARGGLRTLVLERGADIGSPVRTSGASWLADLRELGIPDHLAHPLHRVRFLAPGRAATWDYPIPAACVLDVRGVYQHLAAEAAQAGAEIRLRHPVTGPLIEDGRVAGVQARDELGRSFAVRARLTVDASGMAGVMATKAGLRGPYRRLGVGAEYELVAPAFDQSEAWLIVGRGRAPRGYAWAFPRGGSRVRLGVGVLRPESDLDPKALLARLLDDPQLAAPFRGAQPLEYHTGVLPAEPLAARLSTDGLLLAGDSASQASPVVGEGIRYAIRAGRLAGQVAAEAIAADDVSANRLARYDRAWRQQFGREMALGYWLNRRLVRYGDRNWRVVAAILDRLGPGLAASALHGDVSASFWLRLAFRSPWLAGAAVSALRDRR